eukprot:g23565.t1
MLQGTGINIFKDTVKNDPTLPFRGVIAVGFPDLPHHGAAARCQNGGYQNQNEKGSQAAAGSKGGKDCENA